MQRSITSIRPLGAVVVLAAALFAGPVSAQSKDYTKVLGFVDKDAFTDLVGEDDVQIEVWLPGSLLQIVKAVDPELGDLVSGLELAQALVVETDDVETAKRLTERMRLTESALLKKNWVRLAKVKDGSEHVTVLILNDEDAIRGLTVMVYDGGPDGSFVFANVAGVIDLAAIQRLGEQMDIPGLNQLKTKEP
jgi:hypothetical protein